MPTESEHKLSPLLQALAAERRPQADRPVELHPATRRLLLGEVARTFPKRHPFHLPAPGFFGRLWPRALGTVGFLVVVVVVGWSIFTFWDNLPRVHNVALNDADPPSEINFSLRRSPADIGARNQMASAAKQSRAKSIPTDADKSPGVKDSLIAPNELAAAEALKKSGKTRAPTAVAQPSLDPFAHPMERPGGATRPDDAFDFALSRTVATGGVAALTDTKKPASGSRTELAFADAAKVAPEAMRSTAPQPATKPPGKSLAMASTAPALDASAAPAPTTAPSPPVVSAALPTATASLDRVHADDLKTEAVAALMITAKAKSSEIAARLLAGSETYLFDRVEETPVAGAQVSRGGGQAYSLETGAVGGRLAQEPIPMPILSRFQLQRAGPQVKVIDADGSVYEGKLAALTNEYALSDYSFRAFGTNRTLNQPVTIVATVSSQVADNATIEPLSTANTVAKESRVRSRSTPAATPQRSDALALQKADTSGAATNSLILQGTFRLGLDSEHLLKATGRSR